MKQTLIAVWALLLFCPSAFSSDDWSYECSEEAKQIYETRKVKISCDRIAKLLKEEQLDDVYIAIRDAGLWKLQGCSTHINKNREALEKVSYIRDAMAFYSFRLGDESQLKVLSTSFDEKAKEAGDHWVIELFGFLEDWDVSGRRLARHSSYSDGAGSELLCSAISWRRYLYGENTFTKNWFKYGAKEGVDNQALLYFHENCK